MNNSPLLSVILIFTPILVYALTVAVLKISSQLTFNRHAALVALTVAANLIIGLVVNSFPLSLLVVAQVVLTVVFFFLAIFFLGGKVSHETIFAFCAILGLTPLVNFWGVPGLIAGLFVFAVMIVVFTKREKESITRLIGTEVLNAVGYLGTGNIGSAYSTVPDKKDIADQIAGRKTFSMVPTVLTIAVAGLLWNLLGLPPSPLPFIF